MTLLVHISSSWPNISPIDVRPKGHNEYQWSSVSAPDSDVFRFIVFSFECKYEKD